MTDSQVIMKTDLLVVGCRAAGSVAPPAVARNGAKTLAIDRQGQPGGNIDPGLFGGASSLELPPSMGRDMPGIAGILIKRCEELSGHEFPQNHFEDSQTFAYVLLKEYGECGVDTLFDVFAGDPLMGGNAIRGINVESHRGRGRILADVVIDAIGDADVAFRCGAPVDEGGDLSNPGLVFALGNVDTERYRREAIEPEPDEADLAWGADCVGGKTNPNPRFLFSCVRRAWQAERFPFVREIGGGRFFADHGLFLGASGPPVTDPEKEGKLGVARSIVCFRRHGNPTSGDPLLMPRLEVEARKYVREVARLARENVPGCEEAYLHMTAADFTSRGGSSMAARKVLTQEDVAGALECYDVVSQGRSDIIPSRPLWSRNHEYRHSFQFSCCQLLPRQVEGLLAAGRSCIVQKPTLRMRWQMFLTGEAAGTAAALPARTQPTTSCVDVESLRAVLAAQGLPVEKPHVEHSALRAPGGAVPRSRGDGLHPPRRCAEPLDMASDQKANPSHSFPLVCAHRGLPACCPENTLPSFGAALGTRAAEIEFDLRLTSDGVPVVSHDGDLGRATGRAGLIQEATWDDIRRLDASRGRDPCWRGVGIPSFEQVLDLVGGRAVLNIHIKDPGPEDRLVETAIRILRTRRLEESAYVAGKEAVLAASRQIAPGLPRACLDRQAEPEAQIEMASLYGCARVQLRTVATADDIAEAHARGLVCNLFFVDEPQEARAWVRRGVDVVLTNAAHRITADVLRT